MAAGSSREDRLEDVLQKEILYAFADLTEFKKFARASNGLCLDDHVIDDIVEDNGGCVVDQKLKMLNMWRQNTGKQATARNIRNLVSSYKGDDPEANAIIMFNFGDSHMYSYKPTTKEWNKMQQIPPSYENYYSAVVVSGKHIYVLKKQEMYRLEYSDPASKWKQMSSMNNDHGSYYSAALLNGFIYVCGGKYAPQSVERYDDAQNRWKCMCDMNIARENPCVVATKDDIYCIGDSNNKSVERYDEGSNQWYSVKSTPRPMVEYPSAAVVNNRIYVADKYGVLCHNIQKNSWSKMNLKWHYLVKILAVNEKLYIIKNDSGFKKKIYLLEPETEQMTLVEEFDGRFPVRSCVAVKLLDYCIRNK